MSDAVTKILREFNVPTLVASKNGMTIAEIAMAEEIARLREQLHLANIDAVGAHGDANELRAALSDVVSLVERLIDTRRCAAGDLRVLNAARSALKETAP